MNFPPNIESHLRNDSCEVTDISTLSPQQIRELVHDLQVHRAELEMQNEELRRIEIRLQNSLDEFNLLYDAGPVGYFKLDHKGRILWANRTGSELLGADKSFLLNRPFHTFVANNYHRDIFCLHCRSTWEPGTTQTCEAELVKRDGTRFSARLDSRPAKARSDVHYNCLVVAMSDLTEQKGVECQLRKSEERLELALETTDLGLWDWDLRTGVATRDARTAKIYGYQPGELDSSFDTWRNAVYPQDRPSVLENFNQHLQGLTPMYEAEFRLITRSGELKWLHGRGKVVERDLQQNPVRIVGTLQDITSHKRSEEALRESEQRYRELADLLPQFVYETDEKGTVIFGNRSGLKVTGYTLEDLVQGRNLLEALIPDDRERAARDMSRVLRGEEVVGAEYTSLTKDGEQIPVITYAGPIVRNGKIVGIRGVAVDIGELKRKEDLLRSSLEERNLLLREIHHRVKNNLQIMASLLALQAKHSGNQDFVNLSIEARSRIMAMALVHDNLHQSPDLSRVKARDHLGRLVGNLISSYAFTSYRLDVRLDLEDVFLNLETAIPLGLIVNELLSNCFKHAFPSGKQGTIVLSLRSTAEHTFELRVADTGVGLPKDFTLKPATSFGINLVKMLVGQLDGEISATTTEGAEFRITFREAVGRKGKKP